MRKFFFIILSVSLLFFSCNDFLDTQSPSVLSSETVFQTTSMTEAALMGVYAQMTNSYVYGQKLSVNWQGFSDIECNSGFSSTTNYNNITSDAGAGNFYSSSGNQTTRWTNLFKMAELASNTVEGIRNSPLLEKSPATMKAYLGEALTLRAMANFELVRYWGDIPYKTETSKSDLSNVYLKKIDRDSIYGMMVKDLLEAVDYLPWLGQSSTYSSCERVSKGFAKGMLARVALFAGGWSLRDGNTFPNSTAERNQNITEINGYFVGRASNWRDYYAIAARQCAEMIGSTENPHKLDPNYENIWKTVCKMGKNAHNENLFEVGFGQGNNGDIGSLMGYNVASNTKYGSRGFGGSYVSSQAYYFYSFDKEDSRRDVTLTWLNYTAENKEALGNNAMNVAFAKWRIYWMSDSYLALHKTATSRVATGVNWILMRYPDIYLMFAEAMNELHGPDVVDATAGITARQALEKVRERAFGTGSAKIKQYDSNFFNAIVNERAWEFGCESIRKQDLVRWGLLYDKIEKMKEALCLMLDNKEPVTIFDKTYQPTDFPTKVYYKYRNAEYIDPASINYYGDLIAEPGIEYKSIDWFPVTAAKPDGSTTSTSTNYLNWPVQILIAGSGLNASYDYSGLLGRMTNGGEISSELLKYSIGNKTCNYRHLFAIYYQDVYESKGYLENSFGY